MAELDKKNSGKFSEAIKTNRSRIPKRHKPALLWGITKSSNSVFQRSHRKILNRPHILHGTQKHLERNEKYCLPKIRHCVNMSTSWQLLVRRGSIYLRVLASPGTPHCTGPQRILCDPKSKPRIYFKIILSWQCLLMISQNKHNEKCKNIKGPERKIQIRKQETKFDPRRVVSTAREERHQTSRQLKGICFEHRIS